MSSNSLAHGQINGLTVIKKNFLSMSEVEQKIASYILENPQKTVNMTMRVLAAETGVSEGSIANFANEIGFDGFTQMKINIAQNLSTHSNLIFDNVIETDTPKDAMRKMMENAISSFRSTYDVISQQDFENAAALIMNTQRRIEIYGVASSSMVALDAYYRFMKIGLPAIAVTDALICAVSAAMLDEKCLAIGISYTGRTNETLKAMQVAKAQGAKTLCVTSYADSPIAELCDVILIVASKETEINKEATAARLTQLLVLDSLCAYIGYRRKEVMLANRAKINDIMDTHYM